MNLAMPTDAFRRSCTKRPRSQRCEATRITRRAHRFRAESFNVLNDAQFGNRGGNISSPGSLRTCDDRQSSRWASWP